MLWHTPATTAFMTPADITFRNTAFKIIVPTKHAPGRTPKTSRKPPARRLPQLISEPVLRGVLDLCAVAAEQRARCHVSGDTDIIPSALVRIDIEFPCNHRANVPIIGMLTTCYAALVRSLRVLRIGRNDCDESGALSAFAALATHLQELTFDDCGLTSMRDLKGRCESLRRVNLSSCQRLSSIDALADRVYLQEVDASDTAISSIESLRTCPALIKVVLNNCEQLSTLQGIECHQWLQEVDVSGTAIPSIEPLSTCPALKKVFISGCEELSSLQGLEGRQWLQEVDASYSAITSIDPLRACPALTKVVINGCGDLSSIDALEGHQWLREVDASGTSISSLEPLRSCPALMTVDLADCYDLPADSSLPASVTVVRECFSHYKL